ncbi:BTB/POZ domain-containing protein 9-like [Oppia nitens]|uniref:BTB/POZ domain-containing protein 9-like n=1 Tax=Oppia nitens TaxID=1686743 RepID=UPI0023DBFBD5|nr:BTB/POZ domain-containing protein 9-like [Oppia nitens]
MAQKRTITDVLANNIDFVDESKQTNTFGFNSTDDLYSRLTTNELIESKSICLTDSFVDDLSTMLSNHEFSDCILRVDGTDIAVNRAFLSVRCPHFKALFYGQMKETNESVIELKGIKAEPFQHVLRFIYTASLSLHLLSIDTIIDVLSVAQYLCLQELCDRIVHHLVTTISLDNVFVLHSVANEYSFAELIRATNLFIDQNAEHILMNPSFNLLSIHHLIDMFKRDSFYVTTEEILLDKVCHWFEQNEDQLNETTVEMVLSSICLRNISNDRFISILTPYELCHQLFTQFYGKYRKSLRNTDKMVRGFVCLNQNVATNQMNVKVTKGRYRYKMINETNRLYYRRSATSHTIRYSGGSGEKSIEVELSKVFFINHIVLVLFDVGMQGFSYFIEVSINRKTWHTIVDYKQYLCRSYQYLFFKCQPIKYIRISGTKSMDMTTKIQNTTFDVLHFECMYSTVCPQLVAKIEHNIIKPINKVICDIDNSVKNHDRKILIVNQKYEKTETLKDKEYRHIVFPFYRGSAYCYTNNSLVIHLTQPFVINWMSFEFKNNWCHFVSAVFSENFIIQTSCDYENWQTINIKEIFINEMRRIVYFIEEQTFVFVRLFAINPLNISSLPELDTYKCAYLSYLSKQRQMNRKKLKI